MKKFSLITLVTLISVNLFAQDATVNWKSFEQISSEFAQKQQPVLIYCYDENDSISMNMFETTFNNEEITKYINAVIYPIKLNIKTKDTIQFFNGAKFPYNSATGYNSIVNQLLGDSISTPSIVMFNKRGQGRTFYGYKNRNSLFPILIYYYENIYLSTEYNDWEELYFQAYPPGQAQIMTRLNIKWMTMEEMLEKQKTAPKKIFIDIYNNYNVAQTIMRLKVYNEPIVAHYINQNFYPVSINYKATDTFDLKGVTYQNNAQTGYHDFAIAVLNANMQFPAFIILDEEYNLLDRIQYFTTKDVFDDIIHYFGDNIYQSQDFETFIQNN